MENNIRCGILDLDSVIYSIMHPNKILDTKGQPIKKEGLFQYFDKTEKEIEESADKLMNDILFNSKLTHYIAYVKGKNTIKSRLAINPEYKQNRKEEQPKFWEFTKQYLIKNWNAIEINDIEVDDACRITRKQIPGSYIIAIDKDLLNLEGLSYNWRKQEFYEVSKEQAAKHLWSDFIIGQSGDNIFGLKNKGKVYAEKLLKGFSIDEYPLIILSEYIDEFGEREGINQFHKNYNSLYILEDYEGFEVPKPIEWIIPDYLKERINNRTESTLELPE